MPSLGSTTYRRTFGTIESIISQVARELGLVAYATVNGGLTDPFASTDPNILQLLGLLNGLGQDLVGEYSWSHLTQEFHVEEEGEDGMDNLPDDFDRFVPGTIQNRTTGWTPTIVTPEEWQVVKARSAAGPINILVRQTDAKTFSVLPETTLDDVYFEYISCFWIQTDPGIYDRPDTDEPGQAGQYLWFERRLLVAGLKLRFLQAKGFPTDAAQRVYDDALDAAKAKDGPVRSIDLTPGKRNIKLIDGTNIPDTGFGE